MDILNIVQLLVKCDSLIVKRNQKKPQKPKSHSHCPVTNLARCQNIILLCQGKAGVCYGACLLLCLPLATAEVLGVDQVSPLLFKCSVGPQ